MTDYYLKNEKRTLKVSLRLIGFSFSGQAMPVWPSSVETVEERNSDEQCGSGIHRAKWNWARFRDGFVIPFRCQPLLNWHGNGFHFELIDQAGLVTMP
ncbi:hypothetical protein ACNKHT_21345 [Shigella flexneri]